MGASYHHFLSQYFKHQQAKEHTRSVVNNTISLICCNLGMIEEVTLYVGYVGGELRIWSNVRL